MITNETSSRSEYVLSVAHAVMAAARTAPKGRGIDNLEIITFSGEDLEPIAAQMRVIGERTGQAFFLRDANNLLQSQAVVFIGTRIRVLGLDCGFCGFATCAEKNKMPDVPCAFNTGDMGIALGSAAAAAADARVDSRIMYSAARAALELEILPQSKVAFAILLSCSGKSPYFDRAPHK